MVVFCYVRKLLFQTSEICQFWQKGTQCLPFILPEDLTYVSGFTTEPNRKLCVTYVCVHRNVFVRNSGTFLKGSK
jgi:hypothetical protein